MNDITPTLNTYLNYSQWSWKKSQQYRFESIFLNESFNFLKINNPKRTNEGCGFYCVDVFSSFLDSGYYKFIDFIYFYDNYLQNHIGLNLPSFLNQRLSLWKIKTNLNSERKAILNDLYIFSDNFLLGYLFHKFVTSTFSGSNLEKFAISSISNLSINQSIPLNIQKTDGCQDELHSIDFFIHHYSLTIGIQIKPTSFFNSIRTTSSFAVQKLYNSYQKNTNIPIFIIEVQNTSICNVLLLNKDKNNIIKVHISKFIKIFQKNLNFINDLSMSTLEFLYRISLKN